VAGHEFALRGTWPNSSRDRPASEYLPSSSGAEAAIRRPDGIERRPGRSAEPPFLELWLDPGQGIEV
jgi:hypothetical protein